MLGKWMLRQCQTPDGLLIDLDDKAGTHERLIKMVKGHSTGSSIWPTADSATAEKILQSTIAKMDGGFIEIKKDQTWSGRMMSDDDSTHIERGTYRYDGVHFQLLFANEIGGPNPVFWISRPNDSTLVLGSNEPVGGKVVTLIFKKAK